MPTFLDYLAQLQAEGPPQPVENPTLPLNSMAAALHGQPDIRQSVPQMPAMSSFVPESAPQATPAGVYGSNVGGFLRGAADWLQRNPISVQGGGRGRRGGFSATVGGAREGGPSAVDQANEALRSSASTLAKRRWAKVAEQVAGAKKRRAAYERGVPRARVPATEQTDYLPDWVIQSLGSEAPQGVVPIKEIGRYTTRARALDAERRRNAPKASSTKKTALVKPHPALLADWHAAQRAVLTGDAAEGADHDAAVSMIDEMLDRARTEDDLHNIAVYIKTTGVGNDVRERFNEVAGEIRGGK